jgi:NAD(P)-dependent dehydrogenase (short-subunit alcohol dehydrogenase family)
LGTPRDVLSAKGSTFIVEQSLRGRVALVTGAAAGIGYAAAKMFASAGASVALLDANHDAVNAASETLVGEGHTTVPMKCDVSNEKEVRSVGD